MPVQTQSIYESLEIQQALKNKTRTRAGIPGENYWQNHINYKIIADVDPQTGTITGYVNIEFTNNSPDTLRLIYLKLKQNLYQKGAKRARQILPDNVHRGVEIKMIKHDGKEITCTDHFPKGTSWQVNLTNYILPKNNTIITIEFVTKLPSPTEIRTGAYDETSYFAGYWFPQLAVYDDIFGWDTEEYLGNSETYNNFANYDVKLTLPKDFLCWATGKLINAEEIFNPEYLKKIRKSQNSSEIIHIVQQEDLKKGKVLGKSKRNTWHFKADTITDFAFAFSDHYVWDACSANNPDTAHTCWVNVAYPANNKKYIGVIDMAKMAIEYFSNEFPGLPYPYPVHTTFNGLKGGGMEFPMMANNANSDNYERLQVITNHEIAHNYFPFAFGLNERRFGWMDEMFTTQMEIYYMNTLAEKSDIENKSWHKLRYLVYAGKYFDLPVITESSTVIKPKSQHLNFYDKTLFALQSLKSIIGEDYFIEYLKKFMITWRGKHPSPYDFFYFYNELSGQNLNWFWHKWFFSFGMINLNLKSVTSEGPKTILSVENSGGMPVPVTVKYTESNGEGIKLNFDASVWKDKTLYEITIESSDIQLIEIELTDMPDLDPSDNIWKDEKLKN